MCKSFHFCVVLGKCSTSESREQKCRHVEGRMSVWKVEFGFWCFVLSFFSCVWRECLCKSGACPFDQTGRPGTSRVLLSAPPAPREHAWAIASRSELRSSCVLSTEPSSQSSLRVYFNRMESYYINLSQTRISNPHPVLNRKSSMSPSEETFSEDGGMAWRIKRKADHYSALCI